MIYPDLKGSDDVETEDNPATGIPEWANLVMASWQLCRDAQNWQGGGNRVWPDEGGPADQSLWLLAAFAVLESATYDYDEWRKQIRGG